MNPLALSSRAEGPEERRSSDLHRGPLAVPNLLRMISEVVHHIQILQNTHKTDLSASVRLAAVVVLHRRLLTAVAHRLIVKLDPLTLAFASAFKLLSKEKIAQELCERTKV